MSSLPHPAVSAMVAILLCAAGGCVYSVGNETGLVCFAGGVVVAGYFAVVAKQELPNKDKALRAYYDAKKSLDLSVHDPGRG
jgi:hypothetical protein